jgi:hypothetical protein
MCYLLHSRMATNTDNYDVFQQARRKDFMFHYNW